MIMRNTHVDYSRSKNEICRLKFASFVCKAKVISGCNKHRFESTNIQASFVVSIIRSKPLPLAAGYEHQILKKNVSREKQQPEIPIVADSVSVICSYFGN